RRLLRRCLERDRESRLRDIGDAVIEIDEALAAPEKELQPEKTRSRRIIPWAVALLGLVAASVALWAWRRVPPPEPRPVVRWKTTLYHAVNIPGTTTNPSLSPDGAHLAYFGASAHFGQIFVRRLDQLEGTPVTGSDAVDYGPFFFSPDSQWIAYHAHGNWKKV